MKKIFTFIIMVAAFCTVAIAQPQQPRPQGDVHDWGTRMRTEKIGFLTSEMGLTPEEAQAFWPVYNKAEKEKAEAMATTFKAYGEIQEAIKNGNGDFEKLLDAYLDAAKKSNEIDIKFVKEYKKVLPAEKVAKLFAAEERFRREQINKLSIPGRWQGQPR